VLLNNFELFERVLDDENLYFFRKFSNLKINESDTSNDESNDELDKLKNDEQKQLENEKKELYKKDFDEYNKLLPLKTKNTYGNKYHKLLMDIKVNNIKCNIKPEITDYMSEAHLDKLRLYICI